MLLKQGQLSNAFKANLISVMRSLRQDRMALVMDATRDL